MCLQNIVLQSTHQNKKVCVINIYVFDVQLICIFKQYFLLAGNNLELLFALIRYDVLCLLQFNCVVKLENNYIIRLTTILLYFKMEMPKRFILNECMILLHPTSSVCFENDNIYIIELIFLICKYPRRVVKKEAYLV